MPAPRSTGSDMNPLFNDFSGPISRGDRVTMLDNLKRHGGRVGFPLLACLLWSQSASAEVTLVEKDGWTFYANGRVGAFVSAAFGDDFPDPTPPLAAAPGAAANPTHQLGGFPGVGTFGWGSN